MKYLIIFILVCNFSVNAMTIECLLEETPDERIYLDINFDNKKIDKIYFNRKFDDHFFSYFENLGWDVTKILIGEVKNESRNMLHLNIRFNLDKFIQTIEYYEIPESLKSEWLEIKTSIENNKNRINETDFVNLVISKKHGGLFVYYYDNKTDLGQCFFKGENDYSYIL